VSYVVVVSDGGRHPSSRLRRRGDGRGGFGAGAVFEQGGGDRADRQGDWGL